MYLLCRITFYALLFVVIPSQKKVFAQNRSLVPASEGVGPVSADQPALTSILLPENKIVEDSSHFSTLVQMLDDFKTGQHYLDKSELDSAFKYWNLSYRSAKKIHYDVPAAYISEKLANVYIYYGKIDTALHLNSNTRQVFSEKQYSFGLALSYLTYGIILFNTGEISKSEILLLKSGKLYLSLRNVQGLIHCIRMYGILKHVSGELYLAQCSYHFSLSLAKKFKRLQLVPAICNNLGLFYDQVREKKKAIHFYNRAIYYGKKYHKYFSVSDAYSNLAALYGAKTADPVKGELDYYNLDLSLKYNLLALNQKLKLKHKQGIGPIYANIGMVYKNLDNSDSTIYYYTLATKYHAENGNIEGLSISASEIGWQYYKKGNITEALKNYNVSTAIFKHMFQRKYLADDYRIMAAIYNKMKKPDSALYFQKLSLAYRDTFLREENENRLAYYNNQFDIEKKKRDRELTNQKSAAYESELKSKVSENRIQILFIVMLIFVGVVVLLFLFWKLKKFRLKQKGHEILVRHKLFILQLNPRIINDSVLNLEKMFREQKPKEELKMLLNHITRLTGSSLKSTIQEKSDIEKEVEFINSYIEMKKIIHGENPGFRLQKISPDICRQYEVPPMICLPILDMVYRHLDTAYKEKMFEFAIIMSEINNFLAISFEVKPRDRSYEKNIFRMHHTSEWLELLDTTNKRLKRFFKISNIDRYIEYNSGENDAGSDFFVRFLIPNTLIEE